MARSIKKAKRVRVEGTDKRLEIQYVVDSGSARTGQGGSAPQPSAKGWLDPDGLAVEVLSNGRFRRTSDRVVLIAEE